MVGESEKESKIICSGSRCSGFYFANISFLDVINLSFVTESQSITAVHVLNFRLINCTFANSTDTTLIAENSHILFDGNTFVNNSGGLIDNVPHMTFTPGGGIVAVFSTITFKGQNTFLNNTCVADICGGGAIYAENCDVRFEGNTSFINNMAISTHQQTSSISGRGGLSLLYTTINITGNVSFVNNSASSNVIIFEYTCNGSGGVALLLLCNVHISGFVMFSNNLVSGRSGCYGGLFLYSSNVTIAGTMVLTNNLAGLAGGGVGMEESSMDIIGTVSLIKNSAGLSGGGIDMLSSNISISGRVVLTCNYFGFQSEKMELDRRANIARTSFFTKNSAHSYTTVTFGGGIDMFYSNMNITGSVTLNDNHAGYQGGGMNIGSTNITIAGTVLITNNLADLSGGGIDLLNSNMDITGSVLLSDNSAHHSGGGINTFGTCFERICQF